jgi:putative endonuclease
MLKFRIMAEHNETGKKGEDLAADFLQNEGIQILERNWKNRFEEIDIIALENELLVIVEVKTRSSLAFGKPEESVGLRKQRLLVNAAEAYIKKYNSDRETRFDIISVVTNGTGANIQHIRHAFSPFD